MSCLASRSSRLKPRRRRTTASLGTSILVVNRAGTRNRPTAAGRRGELEFLCLKLGGRAPRPNREPYTRRRMADKVEKPKKSKSKPKKDEKGVLAALPSTRAERIGGRRASAPKTFEQPQAAQAAARDARKPAAAEPSAAKSPATKTSTATKPSAGAKTAAAKPSAGAKTAAAKSSAGAKTAAAKPSAGAKTAAAKSSPASRKPAAKSSAGAKTAAAK